MVLGLSEVWWQQLLNGALGALVGALVAVVAIVATIRTQRRLFAVERAEAYTANLLADRKRKAELDRQLAAQREDVREQIQVQITEASRQREVAAIADVVGGANELEKRFSEGIHVIKGILVSMESAAIRWSFEIRDKDLAREVERWPEFLATLAAHAHTSGLEFEKRREKDPEKFGLELQRAAESYLAVLVRPQLHGEEAVHEEYEKAKSFVGADFGTAMEALSRAASALKQFARLCAGSPQDSRSGMQEAMSKARTEIEGSLGSK